MTMVPEAWQGNSLMSMEKQDFYRWISCTMEAWDGPGIYGVEIQFVISDIFTAPRQAFLTFWKLLFSRKI